MFELHHGKAEDVLPSFPENKFHAVIADPPYGINFMGKKWDYDVPKVEFWEAVYRTLKPGGFLLSFAGTRTHHRIAINIEDAGFEIRDMISWVYGSGFPKSLNVGNSVEELDPDNNDWDGWGTALKPAFEPIVVARKPLSEDTVAENVLLHGTGGINIDDCRIDLQGEKRPTGSAKIFFKNNEFTKDKIYGKAKETHISGRFPANFIHDGSEEVVSLFPKKAGAYAPVKKGHNGKSKGIYGDFNSHGDDGETYYSDFGSAARFFYCAKATPEDRDEGLTGFPVIKSGMSNGAISQGDGYGENQSIGLNRIVSRRNNHPTVKPVNLMRYLARLVTPPGGTILDPCMGSGSTGKAGVLEGFCFVGIDQEIENVNIAHARINFALHKYNSEFKFQ